MHTVSLIAGRKTKTKTTKKKRGKGDNECQCSNRVQAMPGPTQQTKSEPGLGSLFTCKEVLFSPCYAFIREFLFDAVWFIMKLVIPTLNNTYG